MMDLEIRLQLYRGCARVGSYAKRGPMFAIVIRRDLRLHVSRITVALYLLLPLQLYAGIRY